MNTKNKIFYGTSDLEKEYGPLTFAKLLLAYRQGEEMGQVEMSELLGISKQSLCDLEKGRRIPSPKRAAQIAIKLGLLPKSLIELAIQDKLNEDDLHFEVSLSLTKIKSKKAS
jgi:transcriptional regulator with XRE-family HTH domain